MLLVVIDPDLNIKMRLTLLQVMFSQYLILVGPYLRRNLIFWSFTLGIAAAWLWPNNSHEVGAGKGCGVSGAQDAS